MLPAGITATALKVGLLYSFTADTDGKGLPKTGVTYGWTVDGNDIESTGSSISYLFDKAGSYKVSLTTNVDAKQVGDTQTVTETITGTAIQPKSISAIQNTPQSSSLAYTLSANTTGKNIDSDWTGKWLVGGKDVGDGKNPSSYKQILGVANSNTNSTIY